MPEVGFTFAQVLFTHGVIMFFTRYKTPPRVRFVNVGDSLTEQHHAVRCDINNIIRTFNATGRIICGTQHAEPFYADISEYPQTLLEAHEVIQRGQQQFAELPQSVRDFFGNDPERLLAFMSDPENLERLKAVAAESGVVKDQQPKAAGDLDSKADAL